MPNDWYAASLVEAKAFLDEVGVHPVTVDASAPIVAALIGLLDAAAVTRELSSCVAQASQWLKVLDPQA